MTIEETNDKAQIFGLGLSITFHTEAVMNANEKEMFESCEKEINLASKELSAIIKRLRKGKASSSELKDKEAELTKLYNHRLEIACGCWR